MKTAYIKHVLSLLLFGTNGVVASYILLSSYEIVFLRTLIGSILLILIFMLSGGKFTFLQNKKDFLFIALSGVAMGTSWMFLYEAYSQIGVGISTLIYNCGSVIVMILSPLMFKEKLTYPKITGFLLVVIGLVLINGSVSGEGVNVWGIVCGGMSALTYFFMVTLNKKSKKIVGMENTAIQLTMGFVTVAVFLLFKQGLKVDLTDVNWFAVILLGVINTGFGCWLYFSSLSKLPVQSVDVLGYLEPLSAVVLSALVLAERMSTFQTIGAVLIIGGAMFGELVKKN